MSIDKAMDNLSKILTEATEDKNSVCYVTENDEETLQVAIETMRKYRKIQDIVKNIQYFGLCVYGSAFIDIRKVVEDGNDR